VDMKFKVFYSTFFLFLSRFFAFFDVFYFTLNVFSSMTKIKTNHDCDLCQAALRSFSILLFSLAVVRAAFQQWRCHKAHSSFTLTSDKLMTYNHNNANDNATVYASTFHSIIPETEYNGLRTEAVMHNREHTHHFNGRFLSELRFAVSKAPK